MAQTTESIRQLLNQRDASVAAALLNGSPSPQKQRVKELLELLREVESVTKQLTNMNADWPPETRTLPRAAEKLNSTREHLKGEINKRLRRYAAAPILSHVSAFTGWHLSFDPSVHLNKRGLFETAAVLRICELAVNGQVDRLRTCSKCEQWFYAAKEHQRFCSQKCQQTQYRHTPKFRAYRAEYMRKTRKKEPSRRKFDNK